MPKNRGFTLIELLVVMAIIGVLATAIIIAINPAKRSSQARDAIIQTDFSSMRNAVEAERVLSQKSLGQITDYWWSEGECQPPTEATEIDCVRQLNISWQKVTQKNMPKDPWGNPYLLDENELETAVCTPDTLRSVGPDHLVGGSDDVVYSIPTVFC